MAENYTIRTPDGLELGPVRAETIVDLIRDKRVFGNESISVDGGPWTPITKFERFARALGIAKEKPAGPRTSLDDLDDIPGPPSVADAEELDLEEVDLEEVDVDLELADEEEEAALDAQVADESLVIDLEEVSEVEAEAEPLELEVIEPVAEETPTEAIEELKNPNNRYTIRNPDGLVLGPVRSGTLRDLIEAGAVTRQVEISKNGRPYVPLPQVPELNYLFARVAGE